MIRFDDSLRVTLARNLRAHVRHEQPLGGRRHAAVAVVIVDSDPECHTREMIGAAGGRPCFYVNAHYG